LHFIPFNCPSKSQFVSHWTVLFSRLRHAPHPAKVSPIKAIPG
jgi:hypothetical protein